MIIANDFKLVGGLSILWHRLWAWLMTHSTSWAEEVD